MTNLDQNPEIHVAEITFEWSNWKAIAVSEKTNFEEILSV